MLEELELVLGALTAVVSLLIAGHVVCRCVVSREREEPIAAVSL